MKSTYASIDVLKFFFCICIVALHSSVLFMLPEDVGYYIEKIVFRSAVPFFFIVSGFFLGKKLLSDNNTHNVIHSYCKRLLILLIFWAFINSLKDCILGKWININDEILHFVLYPKGALWFISACIIGSLLVIPFLKFNKLTYAVCISVFLYIIALLGNNYYFVIKHTPVQKIINTYIHYFWTFRNGVFTGFMWIALGIATYKFSLSASYTNNRKIFLIVLLFALLLMITEIVMLKNRTWIDDGSQYISHIFVMPLLLLAVLNINLCIPNKISILLRNLSTGVYVTHASTLSVVGIIAPNQFIKFTVAFIISISICLFFYRTKLFKMDRLLK